MATPRDHIEEIRRTKFSIGGEPNPLTEDLHQAVKNLSAELYAKDVHFLMELIQNAEDNDYSEGVRPSLEFVITSQDITATGATSTLLVFNNERGFSHKNIESICSVGRSTKKGNRKRGYIGEKGIGFKSVFLITAQPYIFSNGYQIRFSEGPCVHCNVGYIVPEWVDENPSLSVIKQIYGPGKPLPTTTIVLPLKSDKVQPVKHQLSSIHPEVLLFLSKIKRLSVREDNKDPKLNSVSAISISSDVNFATRKNIDAESYMLHLSADENGENEDRECSYHMWRQRFPVKQENKVERRMEVEEWVITLAFPNGKRLDRGKNSIGLYAFLPTEMVTNFPFIIQADFVLASSRETILLDDKWNQGILDCVPVAFIEAFTSLVKSIENAPISSLPPMFGFLPVQKSSEAKLNVVRDSIKGKLLNENIVPCESYMEQKFFQKPSEVGRLMPAFWNILGKAREKGMSLYNISSHGRYVLCSSFDMEEYNSILNFLGVEYVDDEWYAKCIQSSNLALGVSEDVYLELLLFITDKWSSPSQNASIKNIPILKYVGQDGNVSLCSVNDIVQRRVMTLLLSRKSCHISWLINWNKEFRCAAAQFFLPKSTQEAIGSNHKWQPLVQWLFSSVNVHDYAKILIKSLDNDRKLVLAFVHFLYHSFSKKYLTTQAVDSLCNAMPLIDNYGRLMSQRNGVLVPANGSRWLKLVGSNPWREEGYVELGEDYLHSGNYAGVLTPAKEFVDFLSDHVEAADIPFISPPNAAIPSVSAPLTKENAFLLLDWIRNLRRCGTQIPERFLTSIKQGSWLKISLCGSSGYRPPSQSFFFSSSRDYHLQHESVLVDIPSIDQQFYGEKIIEYKEELRTVSVMFKYGEAYEFIGNHLMSLAASSTLSRGNVISMLKFIKFLRDKFLSPKKFIKSVKGRSWVRTLIGDRSPSESVLFDEEWRAASQVSEIPFIDQSYYGKEITTFKNELQLIGVVVGFNQNYQLVVDNLRSARLASPTAEAFLLILECIRWVISSNELVIGLKDKKCIKTNMGYKCPSECFLFNPSWGCLLQVFNSFPLIDEAFYGSTFSSYKSELEKLGVVVDFKDASKAFARIFKQQLSSSSIGRDNVLSLLACYRQLNGTDFKLPKDLKKSIREVKWLRTRLLDYRKPNECILFGPEWESISQICLLPFIEDSDNYYGNGIHDYKNELVSMGVVCKLKNAAEFVVNGLFLPQNLSSITPANVFSLLNCIRNLLQKPNYDFPESFIKQTSKKWMKTLAGYRSPKECLLFTSDWNTSLRPEDGPFIDEKFYGSEIMSYEKELSLLGVTMDAKSGCPLLLSHLDFHSNFTTINRIYSYLCNFNVELTDEVSKKIWIPNGSDDGEWVKPVECVLHDKNDLFGLQVNVLEKHYEREILNFFSNVFEVRTNPSLDDYCKLWKVWEVSRHRLTSAECCAFWAFVVKHWNQKTEKTLAEKLLKLPVYVNSGCDEILLVDKNDVFIGDDLYLKDLFKNSTSLSLFVWYPQPSSPSLPRFKLLEIYSKIGVRNLSECVQKELSTVDSAGQKQVNPQEVFIRRGLCKLILGFLADVSLNMDAERRHEAIKRLLKLTFLETLEPITMGYGLQLSSGKMLNPKVTRMIRWDREDSKFFTQKMDTSGGRKNLMEFASYFAEVVAEGMLWEVEDQMHQLAELIRLGFLVEFDEEAIEFLMKTENLQLFLEDEEFLSSVFPPSH
ncbi:hypothetical protein LguiB_005379 [Lonicera macranthoides]